jgi:large subunit ribosomal protein L24e
MPKCSYCENEYELPKGITWVMKDGTAKHFCSSKCRKNFKLGKRKVRWILKKKKDKTPSKKE